MGFTRIAALFLTLAVPCAAYAPRAQKLTPIPRTAADSFEKYAVPVYRGTPAKPKFQSNPDSRNFKTRIRDGIKQGVNFAGRYAIVTFGCGTSCTMSFLVDVKSGRIYDFPFGGEENYGLSLDYRPNSKLLKVSWTEGMGEAYPRCIHQELLLKGTVFKLLHQTKGEGECNR